MSLPSVVRQPPRRRAVVLVGGPAAPYSRAIRIARALAAEGLDVEIAAVAAVGLPDREPVASSRPGRAATADTSAVDGRMPGSIEIRRYRPTGPWRLLGASEAAMPATDRAAGATRLPVRRAALVRRVARDAAVPLLALRRWLFWPHAVRGWWGTLARDLLPADLVHACGSLAIQPALDARRRWVTGPAGRPVRIVYDAIDDIAGSNEVAAMPASVGRRIARRERAWARAADAVVSVNDGLASRLAARFGRDDEILVVPNYPEEGVLERAGGGTDEPSATPGGSRNSLRSAAHVPAGWRIVLFQGRLGPGLGLEAAAEAILAVPEATLVLMGFGRGQAASRARDREPRFAGRHVTLPAVDPDELATWTAGADVMLIPLPPLSANQRDATPNKFWEALAVGLPVVIVRGLREMERLVLRDDLGVVAASEAPDDLGAALREAFARLDRDGDAWRARIAATSRERFAWPAIASDYRRLVRSLLG